MKTEDTDKYDYYYNRDKTYSYKVVFWCFIGAIVITLFEFLLNFL